MNREIETVDTPFGPVRVKVCTYGGIVKRSPEYEDLKRIAGETGKSFMEIEAAVYKYL